MMKQSPTTNSTRCRVFACIKTETGLGQNVPIRGSAGRKNLRFIFGLFRSLDHFFRFARLWADHFEIAADRLTMP